MIEHLSTEEITKEVQKYQEDHKNLTEGLLKNNGAISPIMTILVYNDNLKEFQQIVVQFDNQYFASKQDKINLIEKVIPHNLENMIADKLIPTALSISMEATMRQVKIDKEDLDNSTESETVDILVHSYETLTADNVEIFKMHKKDIKVVNPDGDVVDEFDLEKMDLGGDDDDAPKTGGLFTHILKKFYENYNKKS